MIVNTLSFYFCYKLNSHYKILSQTFDVKATLNMTSILTGKVAEHSAHNPKIEASNPGKS
jgi:hypothetical protein